MPIRKRYRRNTGPALALAAALAVLLCLVPSRPALADEFDDLMSGGGGEDTSFLGVTSDFGGNIQGKFAFDVQRDNDLEDLFEVRGLAFADGFFGVSPNVSAYLSGWADYVLDYNPDDTDTEYRARLYELYADIRLWKLDVRVGQQVITWGTTDLLNPVNMLTPSDLTLYFHADMGYVKNPVPAVRATLYFGDFFLEGVYQPFFRPARFEVIDSDWALLKHAFPMPLLIRYIDAHISIPQWREVLELIDPEWEDQLQDLLELAEDYLIDNVEPLPDDFTNGEGGARLKGTVGPVDMAISYLYIWDDYPVIHLNPEAVKLINALFDPVGTGVGIFQIDIEKLDPPFKGLYHRLHVAGLEFSLTLGDFAFRAEGTYNHNRYTYNNRFDAIKADTITYVAGLEYTFFGSWITVLQFLHTHYLDYEEGMLGSENYYLPMLILRKSFLDDRLEFQGGIIYDCTYLTQDEVDDWDLFGEDYMITPILVYSVSDPLKVSLGANIFGGDEFNLFGYFRENTQVWLSTKYSF